MSKIYNQRLTFEEYLYFYRQPISQNLNIKKLKQILFIHGLEKLSNHAKEEIIGAIRLLRLIPTSRSTIDSCSSQIFPIGAESTPSLEEVEKDIRDIEWQECPVGSVTSVGPELLGTMSCGMPDGSSSLKNSLNVPLGLDKEVGGIIRKRVRRIKKKENTPLQHASFSPKLVKIPHKNSVKLEQSGTKVIHVADSNLNDVDDHRWANKGYRILKGFLFPRMRSYICMHYNGPAISFICGMYYKCKAPGCSVMKYVDRDTSDPSMCTISYKGGGASALISDVLKRSQMGTKVDGDLLN